MNIFFYAKRRSIRCLRTFFSLTIAPQQCILCGGQTYALSLCPSCRTILDEEAVQAISDTKRCSQCGRPLLSEHAICTSCRQKPLFQELDGVFPLFTYVLTKKKLLYSWKIARQHNLTEVFARYLASAMRERFSDAVVVPVPPRPGKIRKTGWDQIEDLACYLQNMYGVCVLRLLLRTESVQQKKLSKEERAEHSKHSYVIDEKMVRRLNGKLPEHVVLLDDVITTGSTVTACAAILKDLGIEKVSAVSLFIVPG